MGSRREVAIGSPFNQIFIKSVWTLDKDTHHLWHSWHLCASTREGSNRTCRVGVPSTLCVLQQYPPPRLYHLFPVARSPDTPEEVADKSKHTDNKHWLTPTKTASKRHPTPAPPVSTSSQFPLKTDETGKQKNQKDKKGLTDVIPRKAGCEGHTKSKRKNRQ